MLEQYHKGLCLHVSPFLLNLDCIIIILKLRFYRRTHFSAMAMVSKRCEGSKHYKF